MHNASLAMQQSTRMVLALLVVLVLGVSQQATCRQVPDVSGLLQGARRDLAQSNLEAAQVSHEELHNIPDHYIVFFTAEAGSARVAAQSLVAEVTTALAQSSLAGTEAATASTAAISQQGPKDGISIISEIGESSQPPASAGVQIAAAAATATAGPSSTSSTGVQAVLVKASPTAVRHIRRSKLVRHVIQDREVASQQTLESSPAAAKFYQARRGIRQATCVESMYLTQGISAAASTDLKWPGCRVAGSKLVWRGVTCGDGSKIQYAELRAINSQGALIKPTCILRPDPSKPAWTRQRFGSCGVQPLYTTALPTMVCSATGGGGSSGSSPPPSNTGTPPTPTPPPPPASPSPPNSSGRTGPLLNRVPIVSGDQASSSLSRIEAATAAGVDSTEGLPAERQIGVAIIDSGIDGTHPDLNVVGGKSWATPSTTLAGDVANYDVDYYGHGTHVAGIVGARNNGQGVVGVVPNTPLYSLKILNGDGKGTLSSAMDAVKWTYSADGKAANIGVINLSVAAKLDPTSTTYQQDLASICSVFVEASNAGIVVTAAAGNYGADMAGYVPASCPTVMAITAIDADSNSAASYSNFLTSAAKAADKSMLIAAPGSNIPSTMSFKKDPLGYRTLSGTSMASPHVAGVAAACIMSGACPAGTTGSNRATILQAAAQERLSMATTPTYAFTGPSGNYYGNLVWAKW